MAASMAVVFLMVRMSYDFVTLMVVMFGEEFLEKNQSRGKESCLGDHQTLDSGEGNDTQEERNQGLDLQLQESVDRYQLRELLLLATAWMKNHS